MTLDPRSEPSTHPVVRELRGDSVLDKAYRLVHGDRMGDYGHPIDNWTATGIGFTAVLMAAGLLKDGAVVNAETAILCMEQVKVCREAQKAKEDNRVDGPGYWEVLDEVIRERERRAAGKVA